MLPPFLNGLIHFSSFPTTIIVLSFSAGSNLHHLYSLFLILLNLLLLIFFHTDAGLNKYYFCFCDTICSSWFLNFKIYAQVSGHI